MENKCLILHQIFNKMKRYDYKTIDEIPFKNGIYIYFENGEKYTNNNITFDRIVRVGTDTGDNQLVSRMKQHLLSKNKDRSIFRKNIGRAFLNKNNKLDELNYWNLDLTKKVDKDKHYNDEYEEMRKKNEDNVSDYLKNNMSFVLFPMDKKEDRLRFEEAIISELYNSKDFIASKNWLGNYVPQTRANHVKESRMWVSQGIKAKRITDEELIRLKKICEECNI